MTTKLLRTHVIQSRTDISACIESLDKSGCNYTIVNNIGGDIMRGRLLGYEIGDEPFVSFVDDDDTTLLTPEIVESLCGLNQPAMFTNSYEVTKFSRKLQVDESITKWSLELENFYRIRPHQTIIYRRDVANDLCKSTVNLIRKKNWDNNDFDIVMRYVVSTTIGWHYVPIPTYEWNIHPGGDHRNRPNRISEIRKFMFGSP